jgi:hypothetical protein
MTVLADVLISSDESGKILDDDIIDGVFACYAQPS